MNHPVLLMQKEKDKAAPARYVKRVAELIPNVQYVEFEGAGHWLLREIPDQSLEHLFAFLDQDSWALPDRFSCPKADGCVWSHATKGRVRYVTS